MLANPRCPAVFLASLLMLAALCSPRAEPPRVTGDLIRGLPLAFEPNLGQTDPQVRFLTRGAGYALFLTAEGAVLAVRGQEPAAPEGTGREVFRLLLEGASPRVKLSGEALLEGRANYFTGGDPARWRTDVPTFAKVRYEGVYPGVDLVFYGSGGRLEFDFVVKPGGNPSDIRLNAEGADAVEIGEGGDLALRAGGAEIRLLKPALYQEEGGTRKPVEGRFVLRGKGRIGFQAGAYDRRKPLVIDPVLNYSTYLGGSELEEGVSIAVDETGAAYIAGDTASANFPTHYPLQAAIAGEKDAFVAKLKADGSALVYSTYLGGAGEDYASDLAIDDSGEVYVVGSTESQNFPTMHPIQATNGGGRDVFVANLSANGHTLLYSTYLGGSDNDSGHAIALDASGNAYVAGHTNSHTFPTANPFQAVNKGSLDAFVSKLSPAGTALAYSTYLGGGAGDVGNDICVNSAGEAFVVGKTSSADFPTASPLQPSLSGDEDAFVAKLNASGSALRFSTFLGGTDDEEANTVILDSAGRAVVAGFTRSTNFRTASPFQPSNAGLADAFVTKFNASGSALVFSTYLGGEDLEVAAGLASDGSGNLYVCGFTLSANFPLLTPLQPTYGGARDAFLSVLNGGGTGLVYSTYLGGAGLDMALGIALDPYKNAYLIGTTSSENFPTTSPLQAANAGSWDAFVAKVSPPFAASASADPTAGAAPLPVDFTAAVEGGTPPYFYSWKFGDGNEATGQSVSHTYSAAGNYNVAVMAKDAKAIMSQATVTVTVTPPAPLSVVANGDPAQGSIPLTVDFTAHAAGGIAPYTYKWVFGDGATGGGSSVSHVYASAGSYSAQVTATDSVHTMAHAEVGVHAINPPVITGVTKATDPFRLKIAGANFHPNCTVKIGGVVVPTTQYVSSSSVKAKGGSTLKAMCPKGVAVQVTVTNNDDGGVSAAFPYTR